MLYKNSEEFFAEKNKRITLMGMSNIGKTTLASNLPKTNWFHFSIDYRLATSGLREPMIDVLKAEMMKIPYLATHLREDAIAVQLNVTFQNLAMVSHYLGKLGNPAAGGLPLGEFCSRQLRHRQAEAAAIGDIADFIRKSQDIYGYDHFINDASGSLCELIDPFDDGDPLLKAVTDNTVLVYLQADHIQEEALVRKALRHPKPLYYRPDFLQGATADHLAQMGFQSAEDIEPDAFVRWIFERLLSARRPRYERIATHGYIVAAREAATVRTEMEFLRMIGRAIDRESSKTKSLAADLSTGQRYERLRTCPPA